MKSDKRNGQTASWPASPPINRRVVGFSLIEMIGMLAILALLTAAITPVAVRRIDQAAWLKEVNDLSTISNALTLQFVRSNNVPSATTWAGAVANWLNRPVTNINYNPRKFQRLYLVDPNISLTLPYAQSGNTGLGTAPTSARIMVVSTIARTNVPPTIDFNQTWNWNNVLSPTAKPASWSTYPGNGYDVCIQRINLGQMFYQLVLVNRDQAPPGATNAPFNINGFTPPTIVTNLSGGYANGSIWNNYYLAGSAVGLWSTNNGLATTYILNQNTSFVFENGTWNAQIQGCPGCTNAPPSGSSGLASQYNQAAINFFNSQWNSAAGGPGYKGAAQNAVLSAFGNLMMDYTMWSEASSNSVAVPFSSNGVGNKSGQLPAWVILTGEQGNVDTFTGTGTGSKNGLLAP